jgi:hypothetical protein
VRESVCDTQIDAVGRILSGKEFTTGSVDFVIAAQGRRSIASS